MLNIKFTVDFRCGKWYFITGRKTGKSFENKGKNVLTSRV